jgi:putative transcriptional regulator
MTKKQKYKNDIDETIHTSASALYKIGAINKITMREFDESCLITPPSLNPEDIKKLREYHKLSQPVFARYLNTSESTIQKWESGLKHPNGIALKLLSLVQKHGIELLVV